MKISKKALKYAQVFVDGDIIEPSKLELAAKNIEQIIDDTMNESGIIARWATSLLTRACSRPLRKRLCPMLQMQ